MFILNVNVRKYFYTILYPVSSLKMYMQPVIFFLIKITMVIHEYYMLLT